MNRTGVRAILFSYHGYLGWALQRKFYVSQAKEVWIKVEFKSAMLEKNYVHILSLNSYPMEKFILSGIMF